ncbi:Uncharacterised protein [Yersinia mollaretii]|nr:Uncharacterised protein [Yersinia mollaretii]
MFLQQFQQCYALVGHNFIIGDHRHIDQWEITTVQLPGEFRLVKGIQPAHRMRVRRNHSVIEEDRDHQQQLIMPCLQMALHGRNGVAHQAKSHMFIRGTLIFNEGIDITVSRRRF